MIRPSISAQSPIAYTLLALVFMVWSTTIPLLTVIPACVANVVFGFSPAAAITASVRTNREAEVCSLISSSR